ncbi:MAG: protein kinase [Anaerolineae bacterium]
MTKHAQPPEHEVMALSEGEMVGQYRVVSQLGFGGMATVYKAYHPRLDRYVAIKIMHQAFQHDQTFLARFEREAQIVARLEHPHIVQVYDFAEHASQPYLVMKYVEGRTLKQMMYQNPPTLEEIVRIMSAVAGGLDYAHRVGVLHRDIKPSNIILGNDGTPYITDFGLARMAALNESTLSADVLLGTPHYISPEQAMGSRDLTTATDLYSLAVVLYELLVGRVPYTSDTPFAVIHSHIYSPLPSPSAINPELPAQVEAVLVKALAKNPADRYPNAMAMIEAFKAAVAESGLTALNPDRAHIAAARIDNVPPAYESGAAPTGNTQARLNRLSAPAPQNDPDMTTAPGPLPRADDFSAAYDLSDVIPAPQAQVPPTETPTQPDLSQAAQSPAAGAAKPKPKREVPPEPPPLSSRSAPSSAFPLPPSGPSGSRIPPPPAAPEPPTPGSINPGSFATNLGNFVSSAARFAAETAARAGTEASNAYQQERARRATEQVMFKRGDGAEIARSSIGEIIARNSSGVEIRFGQEASDAAWWSKVRENNWHEALELILAETDELASPEDEGAARRRAQQQIKRRRGFMSHLIPFIFVNLFLIVMSDGASWVIFPLFGWGAGLAAHWVDTYFRTGAREARRITSIQRAYRDQLGPNWQRASKSTLMQVRNAADRPFRKRREFYSHLVVYLLINLMLMILSDGTWGWLVVAGWGIGLAAHAADTFSWSTNSEKEVERIIERERAALGSTAKRKNDQADDGDSINDLGDAGDSVQKRKNDERPSVRFTDEGEFTDSMVSEMQQDEVERSRRRGGNRGRR